MGCCGGDREKDAVVRDEQKWEYVVLAPIFPQSFLWRLTDSEFG